MIKFIETLNQIDSDRTTQQRLVALVLSAKIAIESPLPSEKVTNPLSYYIEQNKINVVQKVSVVNETTVFDTQFVLNKVNALWLERYHYAYPDSPTDLINLAIVGNQSFNNEEAEFLKANEHSVSKVAQLLDEHFS